MQEQFKGRKNSRKYSSNNCSECNRQNHNNQFVFCKLVLPVDYFMCYVRQMFHTLPVGVLQSLMWCSQHHLQGALRLHVDMWTASITVSSRGYRPCSCIEGMSIHIMYTLMDALLPHTDQHVANYIGVFVRFLSRSKLVL